MKSGIGRNLAQGASTPADYNRKIVSQSWTPGLPSQHYTVERLSSFENSVEIQIKFDSNQLQLLL